MGAQSFLPLGEHLQEICEELGVSCHKVYRKSGGEKVPDDYEYRFHLPIDKFNCVFRIHPEKDSTFIHTDVNFHHQINLAVAKSKLIMRLLNPWRYKLFNGKAYFVYYSDSRLKQLVFDKTILNGLLHNSYGYSLSTEIKENDLVIDDSRCRLTLQYLNVPFDVPQMKKLIDSVELLLKRIESL